MHKHKWWIHKSLDVIGTAEYKTNKLRKSKFSAFESTSLLSSAESLEYDKWEQTYNRILHEIFRKYHARDSSVIVAYEFVCDCGLIKMRELIR